MMGRSRPQPSLITPNPTMPATPPPAAPPVIALDPPLADASVAAMAPGRPYQQSRWGPQPRGYTFNQADPWDTQDPWSQETRLLRDRGQSPRHGAGLRHMDQWLAQRRGDLRPGRPGIKDNMWISGQVPPVENLPFNYGRLPSPREMDRARRGRPPIEYIPLPLVPPSMVNVAMYPPPAVGSMQRYRASRHTAAQRGVEN